MASVTSTQVIMNTLLPDGRRQVRYKFDLLDNNNNNHVHFVGPKIVPGDFDLDADMLAIAPAILERKRDDERNTFIQLITNGSDPFHVDAGGFFVKTTPDWETWDVQWTYVAKYYWSQESQLSLVPFAACWGRVPKQDKTGLLGITNQTETDMNGDMQVAVNTQAALDAYTPYFTEVV